MGRRRCWNDVSTREGWTWRCKVCEGEGRTACWENDAYAASDVIQLSDKLLTVRAQTILNKTRINYVEAQNKTANHARLNMLSRLSWQPSLPLSPCSYNFFPLLLSFPKNPVSAPSSPHQASSYLSRWTQKFRRCLLHMTMSS